MRSPTGPRNSLRMVLMMAKKYDLAAKVHQRDLAPFRQEFDF